MLLNQLVHFLAILFLVESICRILTDCDIQQQTAYFLIFIIILSLLDSITLILTTSHDDCRQYTSSIGAGHPTSQNDDTSCPEQSSQPDDFPSKKKMMKNKDRAAIRTGIKIPLSLRRAEPPEIKERNYMF